MREEAKNWYDAALVDLEEARDSLARGRPNWALFAAHQAVEKALKAAYLVLKRRSPPKTHDLTRLVRELGLKLPPELAAGVAELTPYYTIARYPNAGLERPWESIERSTAERLLRVAEEVVRIAGEKAGLRGAKPPREG
jgi:HEPN domain-containing protein